ncbi:DNA helicase UvrD [Candidatus Curtissbacteria bacterium]|nr:DNA helicase UvrD [Candidatus Curtissbacteria bacterium]
MKFVTDLHLHSKYSRAVSQNMTLSNLALWAKYKGINVVATGDFTHPFWFDQLRNELEPTENGLYRLKKIATSLDKLGTRNDRDGKSDVYFLLSCEVSSIYSQGGKTRRIHNLFFFPTLSSVEKFNRELLARGANLRSDGRPIVGIPSRDLLEIALTCDKKALIICAHAWTPWYSVFGSFSGFDSIEECFGDMAKYIYAIETGLSSDPAMNWQIGDLDNKAILSFSDAHSLEKMGREATVFEGEEVSYDCIYEAIKNVSKAANVSKTSKEKSPPRIAFTIEFYPEEGKYHFTGHRDCNFSQSPDESKKNGDICPVCHRPLTVGVMHRVEQLKTRNSKFEIRNKEGVQWIFDPVGARPPYVSLVPLSEILAESLSVGAGTKKANDVYSTLVSTLGSEFFVLTRASLDEVRRLAGDRVSEAIAKVRSRDIVVEPGYDGKFGVVKIWSESGEAGDAADDIGARETQLNLFA